MRVSTGHRLTRSPDTTLTLQERTNAINSVSLRRLRPPAPRPPLSLSYRWAGGLLSPPYATLAR
eukprot:1402011-Prymnesium_polylepis.1